MMVQDVQLIRLRGILAHITYKPGWRVWVDDRLTLWCQCKTMDIVTREDIHLAQSMNIDAWTLEAMNDSDVIAYLIGDLIRKTELHEMEEWFKYKGEHVRDPHPELKKTA